MIDTSEPKPEAEKPPVDDGQTNNNNNNIENKGSAVETKESTTPAVNQPPKEETKILVVGDVKGQFEAVFSRVTQIMAKAGLFDLLVCVGEFFSNDPQSLAEWKRYQSGEAAAPLATLIMGACSPEVLEFYGSSGRQGCEIARSIYYLGHHGVYTTTSGVTIAYISGREDPAGMPNSAYSFTAADIADLRRLCRTHAKFNGVDILLTAQWPYGVLTYSEQQHPTDDPTNPDASSAYESRLVSELAVSVRPRYHFAGLRNAFFERRPYRNHRILQEPPRAVTRFIGLAQCDVRSKRRFYYAYKMVPLYCMEHSELTRQPADTTECPFMEFVKMSTAAEEAVNETSTDGQAIWSNSGAATTNSRFQQPPTSQFFFDEKVLQAAERRRRREQNSQAADGSGVPVKKRQSQCWFCLSSPEVEKHLVVSVANETYLAMAKGPLTEDNVLILPIAHHQSSVHCPDEVLQEIAFYKNSLRRFFQSEGKQPVFYERNVKSLHLQIQVFAVPGSHSSAKIKSAFQRAAGKLSQSFHELPRHADLKQVVGPNEPYFLVELPDCQRLLLRIQPRQSNNFPLAFGRDLIASPEFLNVPNRIDWRQCTTDQVEETAVTQRFRRRFEPYDYSLGAAAGPSE